MPKSVLEVFDFWNPDLVYEFRHMSSGAMNDVLS